jgi:8-oxo-dGTP pyrophosphatase MutT (NUDIX family)
MESVKMTDITRNANDKNGILDGSAAAHYLEAHSPTVADEERVTFRMLADRLRDGDELLWKDAGPDHITASVLVFDPSLDSVLLAFHAKGKFWVQFGGHLERTDETFLHAAKRELFEESHLQQVDLVTDEPIDVEVQDLSIRFGRCRTHFDLLYVGRAQLHAPTDASDESDAIEWFAVDSLPEAAAPGLPERVLRARTRIVKQEAAQ